MEDNKDFELEHDHIDEEEIVVITDEDGKEMYFREEMVIPVGEKSFAVLSALEIDDCDCDDEECHCHDGEDDDDDNVIIARIEFDEDGNEIYLGPTDEEFDEVKAAYEKLVEEWDEE